MPRFFTDQIEGNRVFICGEEARHITKSLRRKPGDCLTVCDGAGTDYDCEISAVGESVVLLIKKQLPSVSEPTVRLHLYQALPKGDKMEFILQKAVELGVTDITPVMTAFCVSRPDQKSLDKKLVRYQKIALEAAKLCGRGIIPRVHPMLDFQKALKEQDGFDISILFYEWGGEPLQKLVLPEQEKIAVLGGSEGGFSKTEAEQAEAAGVRFATLGKRILRCETAPLAGISIIMHLSGNM